MKKTFEEINNSRLFLYSENDETRNSRTDDCNRNVVPELLSLIYGTLRILLFFISIFSGAIIALLFRMISTLT